MLPILDSVEQVQEGSSEAKAGEHLAEAIAPAMPAKSLPSGQKQQHITQDVVPSTPKAQIDQGEQKSPPTEDVLQVVLLLDLSLNLHDMVAEGLAVIWMSSLQQAALTGTYSTVLCCLQASPKGTSADATEATPRSGLI